MEFKGDEFIRNIEIEKEKAELKRRVESLDAEKSKPISQNKSEDNFNEDFTNDQESSNYLDINSQKNFSEKLNDEPVIVNIKKESNSELNNILLDNKTNENKKKYILLGIALSVLFILTILIIRLISDDKKDNQSFISQEIEKIKQDNIPDTPNVNEKYQEIVDSNVKQTIQKKLDLDKISQEEVPLPKVEQKPIKKIVKEEPITDVFGMETKARIKEKVKTSLKNTKQKQSVEIKEIDTIQETSIEEPIKIKPIQKQIKKTKTIKKVSGSFVQIGAFTQKPNKTLLNQVTKAGYTYIVHKMNIRGTIYNKVLIGPYKDRKETEEMIIKIKKDLNKPDAYILKLK